MELTSIQLIYKAVNAIASRRFDRETEQSIAHAIERELLAINPHVLKPREENYSTCLQQ